MRIAVEATMLESGERTGVARLLLAVVRALARDPDLAPIVVSRRPVELVDAGDVERVVSPSTGPVAWWRERILPGTVERHGAHWLHSPVTAIPVRGDFRRVATVHELAWRRAPGSEPWLATVRHRGRLRLATRRADRILVPSIDTGADLLAAYPGVAPRVVVVPPPVDDAFFEGPAEHDGGVRARHGIDAEGYLLFVGAPRLKKNPELLLAACACLARQGRDVPPIVFAGPRSRRERSLRRLAARAGVPSSPVFTGYVPEEDLPAVYRGASVLVYPSRTEGFGFPPLEAMAAGVPVVASRTGSIPGVVGGAAELVDPDDPEGLARVLDRILGEPELRAKRIRAGRERAARFGIGPFACKLAELYRS